MDSGKFISIGFKSLVNSNRIIAVVSPDSAPVKRIIADAKESKSLRRNLRQKNKKCCNNGQRPRAFKPYSTGNHRVEA